MEPNFEVTQEMINAVPKKVMRRFNPILELLTGLLKKRDSFYYGSTKQKQIMYSQVSKITNFFHTEVCKFAIDFYYDTVTEKNKAYGFQLEINGHLDFVDLRIFDKTTCEGIFGKATKWLSTEDVDNHDAGFVLKILNERLLQLLEYRQAFHYYINQKEDIKITDPEPFAF
ncbi:hypothetical protein [Dyadobacter frigoris]|uniref:Uncharacterized protein n=1 Tax=Dyadobacter frigoris TaxID=2576211 RepID=A0A4U6D607_9BACT|nr:hypothetical protein [Dyadobacter frigoris]TKT89494.1 hypothetical protein FDK13_24435 [Dyadobacter frigoris]